MSDHRRDSNEVTELASQLSAEAGQLYSTTKRRKEAMRIAEAEAHKVTAEAASQDGSVRVIVDASGMLRDLALTTEALRAGPAELAGDVTQVTQQAAARARAAVRQVYEPLRREGIIRGIPVLPPEPAVEQPTTTKPARRNDAEEEASYDERTITRRRERR